MSATSCDYCANYVYDEESESYYCDVNLDEDNTTALSVQNIKNVRIIVMGMSTG